MGTWSPVWVAGRRQFKQVQYTNGRHQHHIGGRPVCVFRPLPKRIYHRLYQNVGDTVRAVKGKDHEKRLTKDLLIDIPIRSQGACSPHFHSETFSSPLLHCKFDCSFTVFPRKCQKPCFAKTQSVGPLKHECLQSS